jgi:adenylate cyclase
MNVRELRSASRKLLLRNSDSVEKGPQALADPTASGRGRIERKLAAALALDIVGYSLMIGHDDEGTHQRVGKALARVNRQIHRFEGHVVSFSGDGLVAVFPSSLAALSCGIRAQSEAQQQNFTVEPERRIIYRMGIHAGETVVQGSRVGGDPLNIAARLEQICRPGEICITATVFEQVARVRGICVESIGAHKLKNIWQPVQVYRVAPAKSVNAGPADVRTIAEWSAGKIRDAHGSIAVLPLRYVNGGAGDAYFADGIVEAIIESLTGLKERVVVSQSSTAAYAGRCYDAREVGPTLGVRYVLSGNIRRLPTTVRITVELSDAKDGSTVWADTGEVLPGGLSEGRDRIVRRIVAGIVPLIRDEQLRFAPVPRTPDCLRSHPHAHLSCAVRVAER